MRIAFPFYCLLTQDEGELGAWGSLGIRFGDVCKCKLDGDNCAIRGCLVPSLWGLYHRNSASGIVTSDNYIFLIRSYSLLLAN